MDADMEIDMTLDGEEDAELARLNAEAEAIEARQKAALEADRMQEIQQAPEEGEIDKTAPQPTKVFLYGVDDFTTQDIEAYARETYEAGGDFFQKVEWIDDSSANLVYDTPEAAMEALQVMSAEEVTEPLLLHEAKRLSTHQNTLLQVRQAVVGDFKKRGARERSRFYLMNPDHDPDEIRKRKREARRDDGRKYRRRENDYGARRSSHETPFDETFYDDDPDVPSARHNSISSQSSGAGYRSTGHKSSQRFRRPRGGEDLFVGKSSGRLRSQRSASPARDGDGRYGFSEEDGPRRPTARRAPTPPLGPRSSNYAVRDDIKTELFPDKARSRSHTESHELFPNKRRNLGRDDEQLMDATPAPRSTELVAGRAAGFGRLNDPRELFPSSPNHRRQDAQDMKLIEVAETLGKYNFDGQHEPSTHHQPGRAPSTSRPKGGDLFSRITGGPAANGRLTQEDDGNEFSIKGAGGTSIRGRANEFSILGASREKSENPLVKELFPLKARPGGGVSGAGSNGNGAADLFDGRIKGRARNKRAAAEDF